MTQEIKENIERLIDLHKGYTKQEKDPTKKAAQEAYTRGLTDMYQRILMEEKLQER